MIAEKATPAEFLEHVTQYGAGISTTSSIPLYLQLHLILQRGIRDSALGPGDRFPPEEAIAAHFRVSRPTANRAVQELIDEGWLVRQRGKGTFVQEAAPAQLWLLNNSLSFSDEVGRQRDHRTRFIKRVIVPASREDSTALDLEEGENVCYIRRLHSVGQRIIMVCDSKLPSARFPGLEKVPFVDNSLFSTLRASFGCEIRRAERCAEASAILDPEIADLLAVPLFSPAMMLSGLAYDRQDRLVETMTAYVKEGVLFRNIILAETPDVQPMRQESCPKTHAPTSDEEAC